ncbi:FMN reductase [Granulibacter bethesdensis]|uniref:flavin reductase n=1 Tax=Granulibacter bethesdensis TaxID=364410 RepID=UPI00090C0B57|nr:flavin reductase [Granulibacter bethesdensis]APH56177.1 FMN reductase [Granulibacter bethesdensis]
MVSRQEYRDAMARLGAAVNVITTASPLRPGQRQERCGFTASAVCSVTDDPPTLLVCMNRSSQRHATFARNGILCVNVLSANQEALSNIFASSDHAADDAFAQAEWTTLATGAPMLDGAVVSFDCRIAQTTDVGTHTVFFCEVEAIRTGPSHEGLIYFGRGYHKIIKLP